MKKLYLLLFAFYSFWASAQKISQVIFQDNFRNAIFQISKGDFLISVNSDGELLGYHTINSDTTPVLGNAIPYGKDVEFDYPDPNFINL